MDGHVSTLFGSALVDGFLRNAAVLGALSIVLILFREKMLLPAPASRVVTGVVLGAFSAASMLVPISSEAGRLVDLRVVPVLLAAPLFGLMPGVLATVVAAIARLMIGGAGVGGGIAQLFIAGGLSVGLAMVQGWRPGRIYPPRRLRVSDLVVLAAAAPIPVLAVSVYNGHVVSTLSGDFYHSWLLTLLALPASTLGIGLLLRLDQQRRMLESSLSEAHDQLASVANNVPGVFYRRGVDADGKLIFRFVSERARDVLGASPEELLRDPQLFKRLVHPEDRSLLESAMAAAAERPEQSVIREYRVVHPDGRVRWIQARSQLNKAATAREGAILADGVAFDITDRVLSEAAAKEAHERVEWLATHDVLTGLPNRHALENALTGARVEGRKTALLIVGLRESGLVNEAFGIAVGDERIIEAGKRLVESAPDDSLVARVDGDEFAVLFPCIDGEANAAVDRMVRHLARRYWISSGFAAGASVHMRVDAGYALTPDDATDPGRLLQSAALAVEICRKQQCDMPLRYSREIADERRARRLFDNDLADAIGGDGGEMYLAWQPIVSGRDRALTGREALLRWNRPGHGAVPPLEFVGRAQELGLWMQLDGWVLREACRQAARWVGVWASVNVSGSWFRSGDLVGLVTEVLAETRLPPSCLVIEITESVLIEEYGRASVIIEQLHHAGVSVAIDDFGAVYSSLGYLHRLPVDKIKLDRSFIEDLVSDPKSQEIAKAVIRLCQQLGIEVVGEGVETIAQADWLVRHGCTSIQGFYIGRPEPLLVET